MSEQIQKKWDQIYAEQQIGALQPAEVLSRNLHLLPQNGHALDIACGLGGNAIELAKQGLLVDAWDISPAVIDKLEQYAATHNLAIRGKACDILATPLGENRYDVILVSHFLERDLTQPIINALKPGGLLFYQTFSREVTPSYSGPGNPDFRLATGELLEMFSALRPVVYREEGLLGDINQGLRNEVLMVAIKP